MKYNFYSLFDESFLIKGLALHESLLKHCPEGFKLWVLCADQTTFNILNKMNLKYVTLLTLDDIEDDELREVKKTRTMREYCWTIKTSVGTYIFNKHPEPETLFYLDSDIYFYSSPEPLYKEFEGKSTLLFPHLLPPKRKWKEKDVGKYNAGMFMFRNDKDGREALEWWRQVCNVWCYDTPGQGRIGDQKYLDEFEEKFKGVHATEHIGADVAIWNIENYKGMIKKKNDEVFIGNEPLICFHYSGFPIYYPASKFLPNGPDVNNGYTEYSTERKLIYDEYYKTLYRQIEKIKKIEPEFTAGILPRPNLLKQIRRDVLPLIRTALREKLRPVIINKQMNNKKRILVTGGLGFIGSNFIELLLKRDFYVINVDKMTYAARTDLNFDENPNYEFIKKDICDLTELPKNIDYLVNFAAESHVDNSLKDSRDFCFSNVHGVHNLLELVRKTKKEERPVFIQISTDEVYGDILEGQSKESDKTKPSSPYSATKSAAEQLFPGWARSYDIKYRICRSGNNYGYGQQAEKLIPHTIKKTRKDQKMQMHGDGSYRREWIQVMDNCEGILMVMEKGDNSEIYNISSNEEKTNLEVVKIILRALGKPEDFFEFVPNRPGQDLRYATDANKIKNLGWKAKHTLIEHIPEYIKLCEIAEETPSRKKTFFKRILGKIKKI